MNNQCGDRDAALMLTCGLFVSLCYVENPYYMERVVVVVAVVVVVGSGGGGGDGDSDDGDDDSLKCRSITSYPLILVFHFNNFLIKVDKEIPGISDYLGYEYRPVTFPESLAGID